MIVLFTDFGLPYTGQMRSRLLQLAPQAPVVELFTNLPAYGVEAAAFLLPAYLRDFPAGSVFLCVVDPGVGGDRRPIVLRADDQWFVGPDNGLFAIVSRRAETTECWEILPRLDSISASFHGRDLFAPAAAKIANGDRPGPDWARPYTLSKEPARSWPEDLPSIVYIDGFGNAMTGLRAAFLGAGTRLSVAGRPLSRARVFSDLALGEPFWYENANGLAEIAVNQGRAADTLCLSVGSPVTLEIDESKRGRE